MSGESKDNLSRITSVLALILAVAAIAVPYLQQSRQFENQQAESMNVVLKPAINGPLVITDHDFGEMGKVVQMPWHLTLSNTGNRKLSVINKRVSVGEVPESQYYTGIDGGIFTLKYKPVNLPINIEPGESKSYYIYVGAMVPKNSYDTLHQLNGGKSVLDRDGMKALGAKGIDIFGNPVKYHPYEGDQFMIEFQSSDLSPKFWIGLSTGSGNNFFGSAAKYRIAENVL